MLTLLLAPLLFLQTACTRPGDSENIVLASTTSTEDSGLFDVLLPAFEAAHPEYRVTLVAVGSGEALAIARRGDADVLLVHSPEAERVFVAEGRASSRLPVMYNDFVLLGDSADPAGIAGTRDAAAALARIARTGARFASRGDRSGTHMKERALWEEAELDPDTLARSAWYTEVGQGMGETLRYAHEKRAYTLSDRGTWLFLAPTLKLRLLLEGDERLYNPYHVLVVKGARNSAGAEAFASWITSAEARQLIATYGIARFGQPLFHPLSGGPGLSF